jgi:hypothetical protein
MARFQVLTAASINITAFWDIAPCSFVNVDRRFRGAYCLHHQGPDDRDSKHSNYTVTVTDSIIRALMTDTVSTVTTR